MAVSAIALAGLLLKELKKSDVLERLVSPLIFLATGLLAIAYLLLTYYFVTGDFTNEYVWQYSSLDLPLIYKISGTWAGQQGTYLLWVLIIFVTAAWLAWTTKQATALARRTQIITLVTGIFFILLTLIQTPFKSIYEDRPDLLGFIPPDGNGLNALLVNFWMIIHPPLMFIGYAAMTIPFAAAIVFLITREDGWEELSRQWARFTWLFLGMGIAVGGVWAYLVLGWGGFWAWDPVETASFIPWLTLTGYLHATALYRKNKATFATAAPVLAAVSFILVLYAAIVVRSGLFNSVHAFGETSTGTFLIILILVTFIGTLILGMRRYFEEQEKEEDEWGLWSKKNVFYLSLLLFVILAFVSFWGITFPAFIQLTQNLKVNVASDTKNFFNVWSYPFTIILLLALGFCLNYRESEKETQKKTLYIVTALTVIAMLPRAGNFYVLDHNSPFFIREPLIYKLMGSISVLSIFPPLVYAAAATYRRLTEYMRISSMKPRIKGAGISMVHFGVVFIIFGAIISSSFTYSNDRINIPLSAKDELVPVGDGYGIRILDYSTRSLAEPAAQQNTGTSIGEVLTSPASFEGKSLKISGTVTNSTSIQGHGTLIELTDSTGSMWVVFQENISAPLNTGLTVTGQIMPGFERPVLSATDVGESAVSGDYKVQSVKLEVYRDSMRIGSGTAEYLQGKQGGSGTFPMVDSRIIPVGGNLATMIPGSDIYVIFQGTGSGFVPLTLKIIPAVNFAWVGILLFAAGIILIMAVKVKSRDA